MKFQVSDTVRAQVPGFGYDVVGVITSYESPSNKPYEVFMKHPKTGEACSMRFQEGALRWPQYGDESDARRLFDMMCQVGMETPPCLLRATTKP